MRRTSEGFSTELISVNEYSSSMFVHLSDTAEHSVSINRHKDEPPELLLHLTKAGHPAEKVIDRVARKVAHHSAEAGLAGEASDQLVVFVPWDLADAIATAYEHELHGLAVEALK